MSAPTVTATFRRLGNPGARPHPLPAPRPRRVLTHAEFLAEGERRYGPDKRLWRWRCPACGTVQSAADFVLAGMPEGKGEINKRLGYACIGRLTGAGDAGITAHNRGEPWTQGCNWTLGGLLQIHELEVEFEGQRIPHFEFAEGTP